MGTNSSADGLDTLYEVSTIGPYYSRRLERTDVDGGITQVSGGNESHDDRCYSLALDVYCWDDSLR